MGALLVNLVMKTVIAMCCLVGLGAGMVGCGSPHSITLNEGAYLSGSERLKLERLAVSGDAEAAARVSAYYEMYDGDLTLAEKFLRMAAEGGLVVSQYNLGMTLLSKSASGKERTEAKYWFQKAADNGFQPAVKKLNQKELWE